jgi:hypothetical protein
LREPLPLGRDSANDGLPSSTYVHVLDCDLLLTFPPVAIKGVEQHREPIRGAASLQCWSWTASVMRRFSLPAMSAPRSLRPASDLMIAHLQRRRRIRQQLFEARLSVNQRR